MKLIISSVSGEPIYEQIKTQIRSAVLSGTRAYNELADEGVVQNLQGKGTFVMDKGNELMRRQLETQVRENLAEAIRAAKAADIALSELGRMLEDEYRKQ